MALPKLPAYSLTDAINALGTFQPLFSGTAVPLGTMLHAGIIIESYVNENFILDPAGAAVAQQQVAAAGGLRFSPHPASTLTLISSAQVAPSNLTAFNWMQLLMDIINAIVKALGGLVTTSSLVPAPATP